MKQQSLHEGIEELAETDVTISYTKFEGKKSKTRTQSQRLS
jgi:hypothetical protein